MSSHAKGEAFHEHRFGIFPELGGKPADGPVYFQNVVAVDGQGSHAISNTPVGKSFTAVLLVNRRGKSVGIILYDEKNGEPPYRSHVKGFVEFPLTGRSFASESQGYLAFLA